jgi:hypothetical protein
MEPWKLKHRVFDMTVGRRYFRSWLEQSLDAMQRACAERATA